MGGRWILVALVPAAPAHADDWIHVHGSQRTRVEALVAGLRANVARDETLVMTRTIAGVDVGPGPVKLSAEIWDSRAFNIRPDSNAGTGEVNVLEPVALNLSVDLGAIAGPHSRVRLTLGRMIVNLGSRRIIAADDYRNTTNGYTGVRLDLSPVPALETTFIYTRLQHRLPDDFESVRSKRFALDRDSPALVVWGGIATWHDAVGHAMLEGSYFKLQERDSARLATRDRQLSTLDLRLLVPPSLGHWDVEVEGAWQWGETRQNTLAAAPVLPVSAGYLHADVGYSFMGGWQPRLSAEIDIVSGDRPGGRYTRFDTIFGMRRADFSPGSVFGYIGRANMVAPALRVEMQPDAATDAFATVRGLWAESGTDVFSQTGIRDSSGRSGRFAGWELDGRARHWLIARRLRAEWNGTLLLRRGLLLNAPGLRPGRTTFYGSFTLIASF